ncbi:MAG: tRNA (adenosine(37)-N6)-threonylcarbamoyltransferase complex transferase subunit TsaD, partial [Candidatus Omnitrophica bacterium]|nr:tRNA (adenosine(37)-N6)-threonylcarbamoyltransferase complex transferase subunit TsaD [Candidatus Omnitrophota bacterium]
LIAKIAYSFQETVFDVIVEKALVACRRYRINTIVIGGGVAANKRFCRKIKMASRARRISFFIPKIDFCLDNGAMVAALGEALYGVGSKEVEVQCKTISK